MSHVASSSAPVHYHNNQRADCLSYIEAYDHMNVIATVPTMWVQHRRDMLQSIDFNMVNRTMSVGHVGEQSASK